jgi:hypothetical protein
LGQATYTWSHAIDNQSDALAGEYGDLGFAGSGTISSTGQAAFSRQYDSRADRGNSSFDQRHSLVMLGVLDLPTPATGSKLGLLFRDWRASSIAAVRSGFPFTVLANPNTLDVRNPRIVNNRANVLNSTAVYTHSAAAGGEMVLTTAAFGQPRVGELGNAGRNAFRSPGFWNVDFSLSRSIKLPRLGDSATLVLRADVFNLLNHANLGVPDTQLGSRNFGLALYGRQGYSTGFPAVVPFRETARQIQLMLRLEF